MVGASARAGRVSFRSVNRRGQSGYDPGLQRHHILPRQLLGQRCFGRMFDRLGRTRLRFDDFRANGLLLPAREDASIRLGLPLHRGPHRHYNTMVIERVGQIENRWSVRRVSQPLEASEEAIFRIGLLRGALRRRLLQPTKRLKLNAHDPLGQGFDFTELDAMAESLFKAS